MNHPLLSSSRRMHVSIALGIGTVLLLLAGVVGCGDDEGSSPTSSTAPTSSDSMTEPTDSETSDTEPPSSSTSDATTEPTVSLPPTEQEIVDRYVGYWRARFEANADTPDPDDPALRDFATGEQLAAVVAETQSNFDEGLAFEPAAEPHDRQRVTVLEVDDDRAVVHECVVSDGVIVRRDTGEVVDDEIATHSARGEMLRVDGVWRVARVELVQRWEGVAGCALDS